MLTDRGVPPPPRARADFTPSLRKKTHAGKNSVERRNKWQSTEA
nr:MAG TPA: hypothetical protein [Caudoviricetes sp.]